MDRTRVVLVTAALVTAAAAPCPAQLVSYTGATVWDGTGAPARAATILVQDGRILRVGGSPPEAARVVDMSGRWVLPGLVNAHGHVSGLWAPEGVMDEAERIREDLRLYARYGVTTVVSLGDDADVIARARAAGDRDARARLRAAGPVVAASDPAAARAEALANVEAGAHWLKLRVDDNLGSGTKMPWDAVQAVLDVSDARGVPLATHLFYLEDAKRLLRMGTDLVAHSVRDADVDDELIGLLRETGVCYVPTLVREVSTFVYAERPDFFDDPFFQRRAHAGEVARVSDPDFQDRMRRSPTAARYREALVQAQANVAALVRAGVPVAFGTDSGPAGRFPGYFEHLELGLMVDAGLTPEQALRSATAVAASCVGLDDVGTLEPGKWADFLVFAQDPLADIGATRSLERVFVGGNEVR